MFFLKKTVPIIKVATSFCLSVSFYFIQILTKWLKFLKMLKFYRVIVMNNTEDILEGMSTKYLT